MMKNLRSQLLDCLVPAKNREDKCGLYFLTKLTLAFSALEGLLLFGFGIAVNAPPAGLNGTITSVRLSNVAWLFFAFGVFQIVGTATVFFCQDFQNTHRVRCTLCFVFYSTFPVGTALHLLVHLNDKEYVQTPNILSEMKSLILLKIYILMVFCQTVCHLIIIGLGNSKGINTDKKIAQLLMPPNTQSL